MRSKLDVGPVVNGTAAGRLTVITAMPRIAIAMHDFDAAVRMFGDVFGMPVLDFSDRTVPSLGAHVAMCIPEGGSNIELMSPADPDKPLSQALQKFLDRRGDGLYALMLEAPDPDAEADTLAERGLDVLPLMVGAAGRDVHPRSTHGVLIRVYPDNSVPARPGTRAGHPDCRASPRSSSPPPMRRSPSTPTGTASGSTSVRSCTTSSEACCAGSAGRRRVASSSWCPRSTPPTRSPGRSNGA